MTGHEPCLVFDVGGTSVRAGIYDSTASRLSGEITRSTPSHWTFPDASADEIRQRLFDEMASMARALSPDREPAVLSVAFPGPIDPSGNVLHCPTVWGDRDPLPYPLREALERLFPRSSVHVLNDVTAAGYRYLEEGSLDLCIVTVSSGIGHKVFIEGRPALGPMGRGGEIGHLRVDPSPSAPLCDCGGRGHLAAVASGRGVLSRALREAASDKADFNRSGLWRRLGGDASALDNRMLVEAFHAGDRWVSALIRDAARHLGRIIAALHLAVGTERFVIVGGFALALGERYREELARAAADSAWDRGQDWDRSITLGAPEDAAGLIGAGRYAISRVS